jgi:hypothetical protein
MTPEIFLAEGLYSGIEALVSEDAFPAEG